MIVTLMAHSEIIFIVIMKINQCIILKSVQI